VLAGVVTGSPASRPCQRVPLLFDTVLLSDLFRSRFYDETFSSRLSSITQPTILSRVERKSFSNMHCSVAQCLEVVGEWWSLLIVRDSFFGVTRFDDFQERLGISRNVLNQRLDHLVQAGVLVKVPYREHPPRHDYRLTDKGRDLWPVITTMRQWGDKHAAPDGSPLQLIHKDCGEISHALLTCSTCGKTIGPKDVRAISGPGAVEPLIGTA
jgi:DNA-binding HxlR family transcriptional regulator